MWEKGNILVIDDDEAMRESICDQLETFGFRTKYIVDMDDLVEAMEGTIYNAALLSIHMFAKYGETIVNSIHEKAPGLPVIAVTEFTARELNKRVLKAGIASLLSKPFTFNNLLTEINRAMSKEEKLED